MKKVLYVVVLYAVFGYSWIYFSDKALFSSTDSIDELLFLENIKGYIFVTISAILIFIAQFTLFGDTLKKNKEISSLYENPELGLIKTTVDGRITYLSPNVLKWLEMGHSPLRDQNLNDLIADDQEPLTFTSDLLTRTAMERKFKSVSGDYVWLSLTCTLHDNSRLFSATNVTRLRAYRSRLMDQLNEKNSLINSTDDMIWSVDSDLNLLSFNDAFQNVNTKTLGRPMVVGQPILLPEFGEEICEQWRTHYMRSLAGSKFTDEIVYEVDERQIRIEINFNPITDTTGKITGVSCFSKDITQKSQLDQEKDALITELENKNEFIETVLKNVPLGIVVSDLEMQEATYFNDQFWEIYGWQKTDFADEASFYEKVFPNPEYRKYVYEMVHRDTAGGDPKKMIWRNVQITTKSGEKKVIDGQTIPLPSQGILIGLSRDASKLFQSQEKLDLIVDAGQIGTWTLDLPNQKMVINEHWARMLGYQKEELEKVPEFHLELLHPLDREKVDQRFEELMSGNQEDFSLELRLKSKDGGYRWVISNGRTVRVDQHGGAVQVAGIHLDITRLKMAETELLRSKEKFQWILEKMTDAYVVFDNDWNYIYLNDKAAEMLHHEKTRLIGKNVWEIFPDDVGGPFHKLLQKVKKEQIPRNVEMYYEPFDVWYEDFIYPSEEGIAVFYHDVTKRKKVEQELKKRDDSLQIFLQNASDAILACNARGQIIFYNKILRKWIDLEDPDKTPPQWPSKYEIFTMDGSKKLKKEEFFHIKALREDIIQNEELMIRVEGQEPTYIEVNGSAMFDKEHNKIGAMVVMRDITDRFVREVEINSSILDTLEEERSSIASEIHDGLGQYLGISSMNLQNLALDFQSVSADKRFQQAQEFLELSIDSCRNIAHHLMPKSVQDLGLVGAIEELVDVYNRNEDFQIVFQNSIHFRPPAEVELHVYRVIQEAVNNIRKHAQAKSCNISLQHNENNLLLTVLDDGNGFDLPSLRHSKTGLGLTTMKRRIQKLEGIIDIDSDMGGTAIHISVPVVNVLEKTSADHE